jgi:S-adenosylmethionine decarboxylase proenzyme
MTMLGIHVLADLYECDPAVLDDAHLVRKAMLEGVRRAGATHITDFVHRFSPQGVSGVVVIAESHFSIHTWPEHGFAAVDVFTCGTTLRPDEGVAHVADVLRSRRRAVTSVRRGEALSPHREGLV